LFFFNKKGAFVFPNSGLDGINENLSSDGDDERDDLKEQQSIESAKVKRAEDKFLEIKKNFLAQVQDLRFCFISKFFY
jgi:hypothetical protein